MTAGRVVVLGVGNLLLSDDGLGVRVIEDLQRRFDMPDGVELVDGGVSGMELLGYIAGVEHLIIVDAIRAGRGPGVIVRLTGGEIPRVFRLKLSPHHVGLSDVFATLELSGESPRHVVALGTEPRSLGLGMELTPEVAALVPELSARVIAELEAAGCQPLPLAA